MQLVERHYITPSCKDFTYCEMITHKAKNLYNAALYAARQYFFHTKKYYSGVDIINEFTKNNQEDYRALPTKVAKQIIRQVHKDFSSFFALHTKKKQGAYTKPVRIPSYKKKDGYTTVTFPKESISKRSTYNDNTHLYTHTVCSRDKQYFMSFVSRIPEVDNIRIVPKYDGKLFIVEVVYTVNEKSYVYDNGRYLSIDPGTRNLMALFFNFGHETILINGGPIKSMNQYYNKKKAYYRSLLDIHKNHIRYDSGQRMQVYTSAQIQKLHMVRDAKIRDMLHKITRYVVNLVVSLDVSKVIIGSNKNWKQDITLGKRNNQMFVSIPHSRLISMLKYKLALVGVELIATEESYTSKCSALDKEDIRPHDTYLGKRIHRGLFRTHAGLLINADVNAAINIMRKVIPNEYIYFDGIEDVAVRPRLHTVT